MNQVYSLTKAQKRIWFNLKSSETPLPNIVMVYELQGIVDIEILRKSIENVVEENSILKSTIYAAAEHLERIENPLIKGCLEVVDLTKEIKPADIYWILQNIAETNFNLGTGPLFQFHLIKQYDKKFYFTVLVHPIVIDRSSLKYLLEEISRHYNILACQDNVPREEFFDFNQIVQLEKKFYESEKYRQGLIHWTNTLKANHFYIDLPKRGFFHQKEYVDSPFFELTLENNVRNQVMQFAKDNKIDYSIVLLAAYQALLFRYTSNPNVIVSYSSAVYYTDKKIFGCLENRLPLRVLIKPDFNFHQLITLTSQQLFYDKYYKDVQINDIVKSIRDKYDSHFSGVFSNTSFDFNYLPYDSLQLANVSSKLIPKFMKKFVPEQLAVYYHDDGESLSLLADFDERTDVSAVKNLLHHFQVLLTACLLKPYKEIANQPLLTQQEFQKIIIDWNQTETEYPKENIISLFEKQVDATPNTTAIVFEKESLTYLELNQKANQLANVILEKISKFRNEYPDILIGICLPRSIQFIIGMLAILKARAAFIPLDPSYPKERLTYILNDTNIKLVLCNDGISKKLDFLNDKKREIINLDTDAVLIANAKVTNLSIKSNLNELAYIIYTSGSTGLPKGVMIEHKSIPNLTNALQKKFNISNKSRVLQFVAMTFDVAIGDIFSTLTCGASLYVINEALKQDAEKLFDYMEMHAINCICITPSFLKLLPKKPLPELKTLIFGGDVCDQETFKYWSKGRVFINGYGPTEVTVFSTCATLKAGDPVNCIGRQIQNLKAYILDNNLQPVPLGMIGELYLGGIGLSRGYLNRNELTGEKFIRNPYLPIEKFYKTGDLVRWLSDGTIEYIGRVDFEVKIRGFRIQLGDIEHIMQLFPGVTQATTKIWEKPGLEKIIAAYYVVKENSSVSSHELKNHIQKYLPEYMTPTYFIELDKIPLSIVGKINKALLPDPFPKSQAGIFENKEEKILQGIWAVIFRMSENMLTPYSDFFELGGHSLLATQLISRLKSTFNINISVRHIFQYSQLKQLARFIQESQSLQLPKLEITKAPDEKYYSPSYSQLRMWFFYKTAIQSNTYNILFSINFLNSVDVFTLRKSLSKLFSSHEILRSFFTEKNGEIYTQINSDIAFDIPIVDCSSTQNLKSEIEKEKIFTFDLTKAPLFRCKLLLVETRGITLLLNIHHIIFDGWSLDVFMRELEKYYTAFSNNKNLIEQNSEYQFKDFAYSQHLWVKLNLFDQQLAYWQRKLYTPLPILELPVDKKRPSIQQFNGDCVRFSLPENLVLLAKKIASSHKTSLFSFFLTAYYILLNKITHQTDLIVGSPIANRGQQELEQLIGCLANVVAYRLQLDEYTSFDNLLKIVNEDVIATQENQDIPFDLVVNQIQTTRDVSRNPVFQTMFILQNGFKISNQWAESNISYNVYEEHTSTSKFDMMLVLFDESVNNNISGYFEFNTNLFQKSTIENFVKYFINILNSVSDNSKRIIENISLLSPDDFKLIIENFNQTDTDYKPITINQAFESQVLKTPNAIALVYSDKKLTYQQLNIQANQLAHYIKKNYPSNAFIGICMDRGIDLIIAILAILKCGSAYVPLDPNYPTERLRYILNETNTKLILTNSVTDFKFLTSQTNISLLLVENIPEIQLAPTDNPDFFVKPTDLAYVIYTSGSTGLPKGVLIEHQSVPNLAYARKNIIDITPQSRILQFASINFDAAVGEIFETLLNGATLYLLSEDIKKSPELLLNYIENNEITFAVLPPALLKLLPSRELPKLTGLSFAGDICDLETMIRWSRDRKFYNGYGPTETTVYATTACLNKNDLVNCIGRPLPNYKAYVLNKNLMPVPIGVYGELYIGGIGLSRGYLNRPDLTVERFIVNPFNDDPSVRLYKTGDVVRWLMNGSLEYIGRSDFQVQIRGFRVELGEVENVLCEFSKIQQSSVICQGEGEFKRLVAFYVAANQINVDDVKRFMQSKLPDYMIPASLISIPEMPLTPSGKIDKKTLLNLVNDITLSTKSSVTPRNDAEKKLLKIWQEFFPQYTIGVLDNFFDCGGNSLLSIRMLAQVKKEFHCEINLAQFFQHPTIEHLAELVQGKSLRIQDALAIALEDAGLEVIQDKLIYSNNPTDLKHILLTGANGFLGIHLLLQLLHDTRAIIHCIVRGKNAEDMMDKISYSLKRYQLQDYIDHARIRFIQGDLSQTKLGITQEQWEFLAEHVDAIYHAGAFVHHIYDYQTLKPVNVNGTIELIKLASYIKPKYFHYISTVSAASKFDENGIALETWPGEKPPQMMGYILTKWVAEKIIHKATKKDLKAIIYRPGNITGHSKTGLTNFENNHSLLILKTCLQLGVAPAWQTSFELGPVDIVSHIIVNLSLRKNFKNGVYHVGNPNRISYANYFKLIQNLGLPLKIIDPETWSDHYLKNIDEKYAMYSFKDLYTDNEEIKQSGPRYEFSTKNLEIALKELSIQFPNDFASLVKIYLGYLMGEGFISSL